MPESIGISSNRRSGSGWLSALPIVGGLLGSIGQKKRAKKQHERQKELMGIQSENQKMLNKQGQALQMQTWRDTGYGAQMGQMKEAGLNPALMYGMSGGGGQTTGSQSGGSAQSGSAAAPMDIGAIAQVALMTAQAGKLKAETANIEKDSKNKEVTWSKIVAETVNLTEDSIRKNMENDVKYQSLSAEIKKIKEDALNAELNNQLTKLKTELTEEQVRELSHRIWQNWVKAGSFAIGALSGIIGGAIKGLFKGK